MKLLIKHNLLLFLLVTISCNYDQSIASANNPLSATFIIVPNSMKDTQYQAEIILLNTTNKTLSDGWQLQFNFSSPDQTIKKISSGTTTLGASSPITISNLRQHVRTSPQGKRTIRMTVNKNAGTIPAIPVISTSALVDTDGPSNLTVHAA
jgi:hypothetical protein